jgi:hypothetical protein
MKNDYTCNRKLSQITPLINIRRITNYNGYMPQRAIRRKSLEKQEQLRSYKFYIYVDDTKCNG